METKITVIVDNIPFGEIAGEWGLCLLVEHANKTILVDTGASELFAKNVKKLGHDLQEVDFGVLSHAHYDHANGMPRFFQENKNAKFYIRDAVAENCYFKKYFVRKYIGIPRNVLTDYANRIEAVSGDYELYEGAYLIPHKTKGLDALGKRENMYQRGTMRWSADDFSHEQSLVLDTKQGLVIINSCSHGGVANIIREVMTTFPDKHVYGMIGGFHLFNKSEEEIRTVAQEIKRTGIDYVCTGHCTKNRAYNILKEELGDKLEQLSVGLEIVFSIKGNSDN